MTTADATAPWWEQPYRIVQTNLRLTDADLDPNELARSLREFGASAVTFNVGGIFAFYPTELELQGRNPYLTRDLTGDMLEAAHREGLRMVGRFDLSKGTRVAYDAHPEWFVHNAEGEPQEYNGTYQACVNGGWSLDYAQRILQEALTRYVLDGAFFNMTGYQPVDYSGRYRGICHCANCQTAFSNAFGKPLPARENFTDPSYRDYLLFKRQTSLAAAQRIYDTVKALRPSTGVMGNGKGPCDFMRLEIQRSVSRPAPEWPHQPGELARWGAAIGRGKAYSCASTNFLDYQWRFASETPHNHMLRFGQQIASGAQIDYYLLGLLDQENSAPLRPVHEFMKWHAANGDHLTGTRSEARVALYHSRASMLHAGATRTAKQHENAFRGAYRLLLEGRVPFDFLSDERMGDADAATMHAAYDVILLSNVSCLSDDEARLLDDFIGRGGTIIATGETGLYDERGNARETFALASFPVERVVQASSGLETSLAIGVDELDFPETRLIHLDGWFLHCSAKEGVEGMLTLLPQPNYGPPELCFPDAAPGSVPGVLTARHGYGSAIYLPWLPEWMYFRDGLPEHRELIRQLVELSSQTPVKLVGPGPVEVTVRSRRGGQGELAVHLVNYAGQRQSAYEEPPAISGLRLGVRGASDAGRALVAGVPVPVSPPDDSGYVWLDVPPLKYFEVIILPVGEGSASA
jgi:hypothetical protein